MILMTHQKKEWKVVRSPQFEEDLKRMSSEAQAEVEKAIEKLAQNPYIGEPSKPCPKCGEYYFHSDRKCPFCGFARAKEVQE